MAPSKREILQTVTERELQSEAVKDCAESVKESNPDMDKSTAFAICQDMENKGELSSASFDGPQLQEEDPCWDGYTMVGFKEENGRQVPNCVPDDDVPDANLADNCPEGQAEIDGECIEIEEVDDAPPSVLNSQPAVFQLAELNTEPIERKQEDENTVRYTNLKLLAPGEWTDSASQQRIWYSPEGIQNLELESDNVANIMHDVDNEVSEVGQIDPDSFRTDESGAYGDLVLDTSEPAGEYADENLQQTLATDGQKGFGGPSVEIKSDETRYNSERGVEELQEGVLSGVALVKNPASKTVNFQNQTEQRPVALADGQTAKALQRKHAGMDAEELREILDNYGFESLDEMSDEDVAEVAADLHEDLMGELQKEEEEDMEMAEHGEEDDNDDDEEEDDEGMEMQEEAIEGLREQIDDIWGKVEELEEQMAEGEMSEELSETKAELSELKEEKESLEKRLSALEDEPEESKTLAEGDNIDESDWYNADGMTTENPNL